MSTNKSSTLCPPPMFGHVGGHVYRSAYPSPTHGRFLATLNLRTVVTLSLEALPMQTRRMFESHGAHVTPLGGAAWGRFNNFDADLICEALQLVLDADTHPILLMCATGELQTNAVVGVLRRLQFWCMSSVYSELMLFQRKLGAPHRTAIMEAIEKFDVRLFFAAHVQPKLAVQQAAVQKKEVTVRWLGPAMIQTPEDDGAAQSDAVDGQTVAAASPGNSVSPEAVRQSPPEHEERRSVVEDGSTQQPCEESVLATAALLAPLPLWYVKCIHHRLLALQALQKATGESGGAEPQLSPKHAEGGSSTATLALGKMLRPNRPLPPHEEYKFARLAPLISDRRGFSVDALVDSDDD